MQNIRLNDASLLKLDSGTTAGEITIGYHTFGELNSTKDNVILICHPLTGDSNAAQHGGPKLLVLDCPLTPIITLLFAPMHWRVLW